MSTEISTPYLRRRWLETNRYQKYRHELMLSGRAKTREWLTRHIMSGRILYMFFDAAGSTSWKQLTTEDSRKMYLESLVGYFEKIGEQHDWDLYVDVTAQQDHNGRQKMFLKLIPVLSFPDFYIENSNGSEHKIEELFLFFNLMVTCIKDGKMVLRPTVPEGMRTLFHDDEYNSGYIHSHLSTHYSDDARSREREVRQLKTFCIGNDHQEEIIALLGANYDTHLFASYLMIVRTMVEWESLEGTPFISMDEITSRQVNDDSIPNESPAYIKGAFLRILRDLSDVLPTVDFAIQENHYVIRMTRHLEDRLKDILINSGDHNFIAKRTIGGWVSYNAQRAGNFITDPNDEVFVFGGREYKLTLYSDDADSDDENQDDINNYRLYPKFLDYVTQQLSVQLYHHEVSRGIANSDN